MNFESRQSAYEQLLEAVKNKDVSMIALYGMGGCGKTTLAMDVRKLVEAEHLFDKVLFVPVSSTVEVRRIQEKIASSLQYTFPETEVMERAQRLCLRLIQEKNILVILDDVWEKLDFGAIGIPSSEHHKDFKILITTRSEEVCTSMDCEKKIYLPILTDEEAWTLFQNKALISEGTPNIIKHMGRLISDECKGLPVAIAAVASSLKGKVETTWRVALNKLRSSKPINIERGLTDPYKCLQLSYDYLDTKEAKSLFLLCSMFPEDYEIPVELLVRYAIGLGVVGEVDSYEEARNEVIATKIKLVSSCLLLNEDDEYVKMHDIVRDVAHLIAKNENKIIQCEEEKDVTIEQNSVRYLWCVKFPNDLDCSNLEFLFLKTKLEEWDGIFKRMGMLKVLRLVNDKDEITPLSTMSLKTLKNLRCLVISYYELSDFSFVSDMKKLQSLSLHGFVLPSFSESQTNVAITQITTLKLLELYECYIKGKKFEVIKRTPLLEELYIVNINIEGEWDASSEANIEFFNTFGVPQTLQRYGIVLGSRNFYDYNYGEFHSHHRTLLLYYFHISNEVIKSLAKKAKDLFVANIHGGARNVIPDIFQVEGGGFDELNKFEIRDSEEIECLIETSNHLSEVVTLFSKLHTLRMDNMKNLRALWHCFQPANGPFENLEKLYISDCPMLTSLFTYVVARCLVQLKMLYISGCDGLKHILADDEKTKKSQSEFTTGHRVQIFQNLQEVGVYKCRELKDIFSTSVVRGLTQLKVLNIGECDMLDQIFGDIDPLAYQDEKEELAEIIEEDKHPHLYSTSIPSTITVNNSPGTLSSLESLRINDCPKLGSIFTASTIKTLTSLEELTIKECNSLNHIVTRERVNQNQKGNIVEDDHDFQSDISIFQSLRKLHINGCDLLQCIFPISFVRGMDIRNEEVTDLKDLSSQNNFEDNSCHQQQNNTQIEFPALEVLTLDRIMDSTILGNYHVKCPALGKLLLAIGRSVEFFTTNYSTDSSKAGQEDYIVIKISNSDFVPLVESVQYLSKQPHGLTLLIMHNIREIELKGIDKVKYLLKSSIASLLMLEILTIEECHGLEHIIDTEDEYGKENMNAIFPNLRELSVRDCGQLKYILGQYPVANQGCEEIHIHFSALEILSLYKLPNFVSICTTHNLTVTWPSLKNFNCYECSYPFYNSINCLRTPEDSREPINDPKGVQNPFLTLQYLFVSNCEVEGIFCLNAHGMIGQQVSLRLVNLQLQNLPQMTYIWVASKNSVNLHHLTTLQIKGCAKLKVVFPPSILGSLQKLQSLFIEECMELKQIFGCEIEASNNYFTFPNLEILEIMGCAKLEVIFPPSVLRSLQKLKSLLIEGCMELKQIFGCEQEASNNSFTFPYLESLQIIGCAKLEVIFPKYVLRCLPELKTVKIRKCKELREIIEVDVEDKKTSNLLSPQPCFPKLEALYVEHCHKLKRVISESTSNDLPNLQALIISGASELEELVGCGQGKGDEIGKAKVELPRLKLLLFMHLSNFSQEIEFPNLKNCVVYECPKLSLTPTTTLAEFRENFPYGDFTSASIRDIFDSMSYLEGDFCCIEFTSSQEIRDVENESIEEGPAAECDKTKLLSTGVEDISIGGGVGTIIESGGVDILAQHSKVVEQDDKMNEGMAGLNLLDKQEEIHIVSNNNNIDISPAFADIRARMGAYKHFVDLDDAQIALLVEAITTYPHLWNACEKFSDRFQAWRLKILANMLLFLQEESGDSVISQREKDFHTLCEEAVEIGFESSWVDEMCQRVLVRNPKLREEIAQREMDENPNSIVTARNEEPEKEFVAKVSTLEIPRTTTSLTNSQPVERPSPSYLNIPLRETHSNALVDKQRISEPCLMNQQKPLGEIVSSPEIPQSIIERVAVEETIAKNTSMTASSIHSESTSSQLD